MRRLFAFLALASLVGAAPVKVDPVTSEEAVENWRILQGMSDRGERVELPEGRISIGRPWNIHTDGIEVSGQGRDRTALHLSGMQGAAIVHGVLPRFKGEGIEKADFVDRAPLLDGSVSGMAPVLHGGRVPLFVTYPMSAWSHAGWNSLRSLTLEIAFDAGDGLADYGVIGGLSANGRPRPISINYYLGNLVFAVQTEDGKLYQSRCSIPGIKGVVRLVVQLDLDNGSISWLVNNEWKTPPEPFTIPKGSKLVENTDIPWKFCGLGPADSVAADIWQIDAGWKFTLLGARLSKGIRYRPASPNVPAILPRSDRESYHGIDGDSIAMIPFDDDLDYTIASRVFRNYSGPGSLATNAGQGWLMGGSSDPTSYLFPFVHRLNVHDISLEGGAYYGMALAIGTSVNTRIENVRFSHASTGLGCLKMGSNYIMYMTGDNEFNGNIYGIHLNSSIVKQTGMAHFGYCGRGYVYAEMTGLEMDSLFVANTPDRRMRNMFYVQGTFSARSLLIDDEESVEGMNLESVIRVDLAPFSSSSELRITRLTMSQVPINAAIVILSRQENMPNNGIPYGVVEIGSVSVDVQSAFRAVYDVRDSRWTGDMDCIWLPKLAPHVISSSQDGRCRVHHTYRLWDEIPDGSWIEGCHTFLFPQKSLAGNWRKAVCTKTGITGAGKGTKADWQREH